ncbi:MAG: tyrosine-type recombinase/integrase [Bacillota bacterium]|nr:tyrosine-type recombinase/integrase [Bacillota bacterium]
MREFHSFLAPHMKSFVDFRVASGCWNDTYESYLFFFDRYCVQLFPEKTSLTDDMVESWCAQRMTESSNTRRVRSFAIANFVNYLRERGATDVSAPVIPAQRRSTYIPHAFTDSELERFFRASDNMPMGKPNSLASRSRRIVAPVFFRLLYSSGIRTYEARMLTVEDVDLAQGVLCIRKSKGPNQHYVALHDTMVDLLRKYDHSIRAIYQKRVYFFPSIRGSFISKEWVAKTFRLIWSRANTSHAIAYEFRHNYAVKNINSWIGEGFGFYSKLVYLSKSMGHATLESTKYYFHLVPAMSNILQELTGSGFDDIIPGVPHEEK